MIKCYGPGRSTYFVDPRAVVAFGTNDDGNESYNLVLLEAVKMLVGNIKEADEPRIIPASQLPNGI